MVDALHDGHRPGGDRARDRWWAFKRRHVPQAAVPIVQLINAHPRFLPASLFPPFEYGGNLNGELEALEASTPERLSTEIEQYLQATGFARTPRLLNDLREGGRRKQQQLIGAMQRLFSACLADDWPWMREGLRREARQQTERAYSVGLAAATATLHADIAWSAADQGFVVPHPVPHVAGDVRVELGGRGLLLVPSVFGLDQVMPIVPANRTAALVYPARFGVLPVRNGGDGLATLIGQGRARALRAIGTGCTTTELAARLGVSPPTASAHAAALRNAALITSPRQGRSVLHTLTDLGDALLLANQPPAGPPPRPIRPKNK
jgi:DNA-binding transcriptional ArsR family regulator